MEKIKIIECFGGIGAATQALKKLGYDVEIVDYIEIDKYAVASFNAMNGTTFHPQDITSWDKEVEADIIVGGFPCQDISVAGLEKGIIKGETRSGLMYELMRVIHKVNPKYVVVENVKNLLSSKFRPQLEEFLSFLDEEGYYVAMDVLNAKDFEIPQNRERVFILGIREDMENKYETQ